MGWGERHELHWACVTEPGSVPAGMGGTQSCRGVGTGGTRLPAQGPACPGSLGMASLPPWCSQLSHGGANPDPSAVGEWGFIFRGGKLGGGFGHTQCWTMGLPLSTGTVLTVCNPSETPVLTLESFLF